MALFDRVQDEGGFFVGGYGLADLIFRDHAGKGLGDGLRRAQEGGDGGVAEGHSGGEAAEAGDQAVTAGTGFGASFGFGTRR